MSWNEERSRERVAKNDFSDHEINVADLTKDMDFTNLGTKDVRRARGAHIYADIPNFHDAVEDAGESKDEQRKLVRAAHVLRRVQGDTLLEHDIGKIQLQAVRLHALCFKPYKDGEERAMRSVVFAVAQNTYLYDAFNVVIEDVRDFHGAVGVASGVSYIANIGSSGNRELICLGTCANLAAKIIRGTDTINITEDVYLLLPEDLRDKFGPVKTVAGAAVRQARGLRWDDVKDVADDLGIKFDLEKLKRRTIKYRDSLPLHDIGISEARTRIKPENLTERNCKRTAAVAIYADLDGFTKYVQQAEDDDEIESLVRALHMVRAEFHAVIRRDFHGVVLQHQGDRTFAIMHMPSGSGDKDGKERCQKGLDVAIGLQSSMIHVLNKRLADRKDIHVAVGVDAGLALVTRLGKRGQKDVVCLGRGVDSAEQLQLRSAGTEIRVSEEIYDAIDDDAITEEFEEDRKGAYVSEGLTFPKLDKKKNNGAAGNGSLVAVAAGGKITPARRPGASPRPWAQTESLASETEQAMAWYEVSPDRWGAEQRVAAQYLEYSKAGLYGDGRAWIRGLLRLFLEHGHEVDAFMIRIVYPRGFTGDGLVPTVYLESHRGQWEADLDGHILKDWSLCLYVPGEAGIDFSEHDSLERLLEAVWSLLYRERIYQLRLTLEKSMGMPAKWPGPERAHGIAGIREAVCERGRMWPSEPCLCGSGRAYGVCCMKKLRRRDR